MLYNINVAMRNGDRYNTQIAADSLNEVEAKFKDTPNLKLSWDKALVILNTAEMASLFIGEVLPEQQLQDAPLSVVNPEQG